MDLNRRNISSSASQKSNVSNKTKNFLLTDSFSIQKQLNEKRLLRVHSREMFKNEIETRGKTNLVALFGHPPYGVNHKNDQTKTDLN